MITQRDRFERDTRKTIGQQMTRLALPVLVDAVSWINRDENDEFVTIRVYKTDEQTYERVVEWITDPRNPFRCTREREGRQDVWFYLALPKM